MSFLNDVFNEWKNGAVSYLRVEWSSWEKVLVDPSVNAMNLGHSKELSFQTMRTFHINTINSLKDQLLWMAHCWYCKRGRKCSLRMGPMFFSLLWVDFNLSRIAGMAVLSCWFKFRCQVILEIPWKALLVQQAFSWLGVLRFLMWVTVMTHDLCAVGTVTLVFRGMEWTSGLQEGTLSQWEELSSALYISFLFCVEWFAPTCAPQGHKVSASLCEQRGHVRTPFNLKDVWTLQTPSSTGTLRPGR